MLEYYFMKTTEINLVGFLFAQFDIDRSRFEVVRRVNAFVYLSEF